MTPLRGSLDRIARDLDRLGTVWALVGGLAVSARAEPRMTRDVDVAVSVEDDPQAERLIADLRSHGYEVVAIVEQTAVARLATARLQPTGSPAIVDLLFASSGIEPEITAAAERLEVLQGLVMPVAQRGHLIALKLLARDDRRRPNDWDDLRALRATADERDLTQAREAVRLIRSRGFHRGRDLEAALDELVAGG